MCLREKVLRIYFEQNQFCIQVWRFMIGKFNRDVLVKKLSQIHGISRTTPIAQAAKTAPKGHQIRQQHQIRKAQQIQQQLQMPKLPQHQETTPSASISLIMPTTAKTLTISHTGSSICTFYKIYHNRAMCINFINHTNYGFAWAQYTNNTTKARIDFSKSEILNAVISLESSGVFTCTKLYESSFKYPIYWYNF